MNINITPYLFAIASIALLILREYIFGIMLLIIAISELALPNLNVSNTSVAVVVRFGLTAVIVFLLIYRFSAINS